MFSVRDSGTAVGVVSTTGGGVAVEVVGVSVARGENEHAETINNINIIEMDFFMNACRYVMGNLVIMQLNVDRNYNNVNH